MNNGMVITRLPNYKIDGMTLQYSDFVPQLYNFAKSLGFKKGKIMPSRAFCSDENQGVPILRITQNFGIFPFNHGIVGGVIATDRHPPHAHHGEYSVIIQASHVAYDPESKSFGEYKRPQAAHEEKTPTCGKIDAVIGWYINRYKEAKDRMFLQRHGDTFVISIDPDFVAEDNPEGLFLVKDKLLKPSENGNFYSIQEGTFSTSVAFELSDNFVQKLDENKYEWKPGKGKRIGENLTPDLFYFKKETDTLVEGSDHIEHRLKAEMPYIVSSKFPALTAAQMNTQ